MSNNITSDKQPVPTDYEALNNTFYSIVDSWLPKDFGHKAVQQTDADVLVKIRKAKEKERHRASNVDGNASTSSIPHANLLKRKLQSNSSNPKDTETPSTGNDDESSEEESRTRSIAKKSKTAHDAFSKPGKGKSKGKQRDDEHDVTGNNMDQDETIHTPGASVNGKTAEAYRNPFAMPSMATTNPPPETTISPESTSSPTTTPAPSASAPSPQTSKTDTDALSKNQRKKQRKKEKKALAREESVKSQQEVLGKLAVGQTL